MCEHYIGLLKHDEYSELVTLEELKKHIEWQSHLKETFDKDPLYCTLGLVIRVFSLEEYADRRRNTDLTPFDYCPKCGAAIMMPRG